MGYLLAGSIIGPGGLKFISEMVQVCCCEQPMNIVFEVRMLSSINISQVLTFILLTLATKMFPH